MTQIMARLRFRLLLWHNLVQASLMTIINLAIVICSKHRPLI